MRQFNEMQTKNHPEYYVEHPLHLGQFGGQTFQKKQQPRFPQNNKRPNKLPNYQVRKLNIKETGKKRN
jgi:hypothetical protein